jgi:hypothetical protein
MDTIEWYKQSVCASILNRWLAVDGKRFKAVCQITDTLDCETTEALPIVSIYAPEFNVAGCVRHEPPAGVFMYLSPVLELESQAVVNFAVAHEFAHIALGHYLPGNPQMAERADKYEDRPAELAADALAASWGFRRTKRSQFEKIMKAAHIWKK